MVGFTPGSESVPAWVYSVAGASSGVVTRAIAQPLDVLKIRYQIQVISSSQDKKYSILQKCLQIYQQEGVGAFWKGHMPAQFLSVTYGVIQFGAFEMLTKQVFEYLPSRFTNEWRPVSHFLCGSISGCMATLASMPFDVIRTRFVTQVDEKVYTSMRHAAQSMLKHEGPGAFFKGLVPTLVQIGPQTGFQFGFYTFFKKLWQLVFLKDAQESNRTAGNLESLLCGSAAGLCAKTAVYPLDLTKKRLQVQGFEKAWSRHGQTRRYNGLTHCLSTIFKEEGTRGLFRGLSPSLLKAVLTTAISFWGYEKSVNLISMAYRTTSR